jgi:hypothetical protein
MPFERPVVGELVAALKRPPPLLQVLVGLRQVGKTTAAARVEARLGWPSHTATADAPLPRPPEWIETQWHLARVAAAARRRVLLVLAGAPRRPVYFPSTWRA